MSIYYPPMWYDSIILGAGPAGLTAARHASNAGRRVLILDKASRPGAKLLLAGGGKGNVTNRHVEPSDYVGADPTFAAYALDRVPPELVLAELQGAGIPLEEREMGRVFGATGAHVLLNHLLSLLPKDRCTLRTDVNVTRVGHADGIFTVSCDNATFTAPSLIAATGSPAWPQCGADDSGIRHISALGHRAEPFRPALVPLVMPRDWPLHGLSGISLPVRLTCGVPGSPAFEDALLFTHKGVSGPAVLQISCWWRKSVALTVDFLPGTDAVGLLDAARGKATPRSIFSRMLPERLLDALLAPAVAARRAAELSRTQRTTVADALHRHRAVPLRTEGLAKAEAAAGGVDTAEVDPLTMQSRLVPGLFFCGEVLDVTGRLGGYNLHWAWASGTVAGESASGYEYRERSIA